MTLWARPGYWRIYKMTCQRCGKCCLDTPCTFAQVKYGLTEKNKRCPELIEDQGKYTCQWIARDLEFKRIMLKEDNSCLLNKTENKSQTKSSNDITFNDALLESCRTPELVKQFDRLVGTNVMGVLYDKRSPIVRMIDDTTGYQKVLDQKAHEDMHQFISFVFEEIFLRLPREVK